MVHAGILMLAIYIADQERALDLFWSALAAIGVGICGGIFAVALGPLALFPLTLVAVALSWIVAGVPLRRAVTAGAIFFAGEICTAVVFYGMFLRR
jgi:hypothetical protein